MSHSTSETGHAVNVANFRKLIEAVATMSGTYNPTNPRLTLNELQMLENNAVASLAEVDNHKPDYLNAIGERTAAFEPLDKLVRRVLRVAETLDLNETALKELVRRIHGSRAVPKKTTTNSNDPNTDPANEHKYVRGALGQESNEYKMIQKLEFKKTKV